MPLNWSTLKKVFVTFEICLLTFSVYIGSAIYSAGEETVVKDFGVSQTKATLGLTLFVAGYGLGPMIWAPMSEIPQIGRNPIYIGTLAVFVIFQVPTALAVNFVGVLFGAFSSLVRPQFESRNMSCAHKARLYSQYPSSHIFDSNKSC